MALDGRALRQQKLERARLNSSIAETDLWIQARIRRIMAGVPDPDPGIDEAGLQAYLTQLEEAVGEELTDMFKGAKKELRRGRRRAVDLGLAATERLVEAQLPTAEEVRRGNPDTDRTA